VPSREEKKKGPTLATRFSVQKGGFGLLGLLEFHSPLGQRKERNFSLTKGEKKEKDLPPLLPSR